MPFSDERMLYMVGAWPMLMTTAAAEGEREVFQLIQSRLFSRSGWDWPTLQVVVAQMPGQHFRSSYFLVFYRPGNAVFIGSSATTGVVAIEPHKRQCTMLTDFDDVNSMACVFWPPTIEAARHYLAKDLVMIPRDSSSAISAAIEAISIASPVHPLLVLDSLQDVYTFSGLVSSDQFWACLDIDSSYRPLVTSPVLEHVATNFPPSEHSSAYQITLEKSAKLEESVSRPRAIRQDRGWACTAFSWSPASCEVWEWQVTFQTEGKIDLAWKLVAEDIGLGFQRM